jgi:hypothetical protein
MFTKKCARCYKTNGKKLMLMHGLQGAYNWKELFLTKNKIKKWVATCCSTVLCSAITGILQKDYLKH